MADGVPDCLQGVPERYRTLLEISELTGAHKRIEEFFRALSRLLARIIHFECIAISIYDTKSQTTRLFLTNAAKPDDIPAGQVFPLEAPPGSRVLEMQQPLYVPDVEKEIRFPSITDMLRCQGVRSYCVLPLSTARGHMGGMYFASVEPDAYTAEDIEFMQLAARQAAVILENIQSLESDAASQRELAERERSPAPARAGERGRGG